MKKNSMSMQATEVESVTNVLLEYESLKLQERAIKDRLEELKPEVQPLIPLDKKVEMKNGEFYITVRKRWTYSSQTIQKEKDLKTVKKDEEREGIAISDDLEILTYKENVKIPTSDK